MSNLYRTPDPSEIISSLETGKYGEEAASISDETVLELTDNKGDDNNE